MDVIFAFKPDHEMPSDRFARLGDMNKMPVPR